MNILNNSISLLSHAFSSTLFVSFSERPSNSLHHLLLSSLNMLALFLALSIHHMPPESLFLHSLDCLVPLFQNPLSLFDYLHYPTHLTLNTHIKIQTFLNQYKTRIKLNSVSLYNKFSSHFFYNECSSELK